MVIILEKDIKYLKELIIKNFQSHADTTLTFNPNVNMITGENSVGKSAIFRAIRFLAYNRPLKDIENGLLRKGKQSIIIKATMNDGSWVLREKGKDINKYVVYDDITAKEHGGALELTGFGITVPPEVSRILGMAPVTLSQTQDIEINMSLQNETAFMLSNSSPEIARWIYSLTDLDKVRYAIDDLNKSDRKKKDQIKDYNIRIQDLQDNLLKFGDIEYFEKKVNKLERQKDNELIDIEKLNLLNNIYNSIQGLNKKALPTKKRIDELEKFFDNQSIKEFESIKEKIEELEELFVLNEKICSINNKIDLLEDRISNLIKIDNLEEINIDKDLEDVYNLINIEHHCNLIIKKINDAEDSIKSITFDIKSNEQEIDAIKDKIFKNKENPICPLCGSFIDNSLINHIIEELENGENK